MLNHEIIKYIDAKFSDIDLSPTTKAEILGEYLGSTKPLDEIKHSIDEKYNQMTNTTEKKSNGLEKFLSLFNKKIYPYTKENNKIGAYIDLKDIDDIREELKSLDYYDPKNDSLTYAKDGNDYGIKVTVDGGIISIDPAMISVDKAKVFDWDIENKVFKEKETKIKSRGDFFIENEEGIMEVHMTPPREYMTISERTISDMNNINLDDMLKNSLIRYSYIAKEKYGKELTDSKINKGIEKLRGKSYEEVSELLSSSLKEKQTGKVNHLGYADAKSVGIYCVVIGFILCLIAILLA